MNAGVVGTGDLAWPGPWKQEGHGIGIGLWARFWDEKQGDWAADSDGEIRDVAGRTIQDHGHDIDSAARARFADAILATICAGEDPHPYPAELLAADGGED